MARIATPLRVGLASVIALLLCSQIMAAETEDEMDTQQYIDQLAHEAAGAYNTAAQAAAAALKEEEASKPSSEELIQRCVCEQRANAGDPCNDSGVDDTTEEKMRAEFATSCSRELAQMPVTMKDAIQKDCIKRRTESAGLEWKDPDEEANKNAARKYIQDSCEAKINQANKPKVLNVVEDAESVILKCMCARTTCRTDEEQLLIEEAEEDSVKMCKKKVAMQVAEAMGDGGEAMSKEDMATAINECACEARAEGENPCMSAEDWEKKQEELKAIQQDCRKPLHDEL